jgi:DNA-binding transcriptional MocR family regulator
MWDRQQIRAAHAAGQPIRSIARELGASRNAVRRALAPGARDRYHRPSVSQDFFPTVGQAVDRSPASPVWEIGQRIDWPLGQRQLTKLVARARRALPAAQIEVGQASAGELTVGELSVRKII